MLLNHAEKTELWTRPWEQIRLQQIVSENGPIEFPGCTSNSFGFKTLVSAKRADLPTADALVKPLPSRSLSCPLDGCQAPYPPLNVLINILVVYDR
jgi:hypothetical protein